MLARPGRRQLQGGGGIQLPLDKTFAADLVSARVAGAAELREHRVMRFVATNGDPGCRAIFKQHQPRQERWPWIGLQNRMQQWSTLLGNRVSNRSRSVAVSPVVMGYP